MLTVSHVYIASNKCLSTLTNPPKHKISQLRNNLKIQFVKMGFPPLKNSEKVQRKKHLYH